MLDYGEFIKVRNGIYADIHGLRARLEALEKKTLSSTPAAPPTLAPEPTPPPSPELSNKVKTLGSAVVDLINRVKAIEDAAAAAPPPVPAKSDVTEPMLLAEVEAEVEAEPDATAEPGSTASRKRFRSRK